MRTAYNVTAVRAAESQLMQTTPEPELMQIAARGLARFIRDALAGSGGVRGRRVALLVGAGNNGGDALFAGSFLARRGAEVNALCLSDRPHAAGLAALAGAGGRHHLVAADPDASAGIVRLADVVVDGIVGIGASGSLRPDAAALLTAVDRALVVAVDVPSGVDPTTGAVPDPQAAVNADVTVTFGAWKSGLLLPPGRDRCGATQLVDIGLGPALAAQQAAFDALSLSDAAPYFAAPDAVDYKYSHGVVGVVAGSDQYPGAPHMVVGAARHGGVGMVRLWRDGAPSAAASVITRYPDVVSTTGELASDPKATAWAIGPGIGTGQSQRTVVADALATTTPLVVDADALTLIAHDDSLRAALRSRQEVTVITPHVAEFTRLGLALSDDRVASALAGATALDLIVLLKGAGTVIADPRGRVFVDQFGPPALATAGTGDALTGLVAAALSRQPEDPTAAVAAAVAVHGMAARIASGDDRPMTSWDLVEAVPQAVAEVRRAGR